MAPSSFNICQSGYSDIGQVRTENEDFLVYETDPFGKYAFSIVADGMGGYAGGAIASEIAANAVADYLRNALFHLSHNLGADIPSSLRSHVEHAIYQANRAVLDRKNQDQKLSEMGTTLVIAAIVSDHLLVANVGDSRAYQFSNGQISQISEDHSIVQELINSGALTSDSARESEVRNQLTQAIGVQEELTINFSGQQLNTAGLLLLCSDGLTEYLDTAAIGAELATGLPVSNSCYRLIEAANQGGGKDNITVAMIEYGNL